MMWLAFLTLIAGTSATPVSSAVPASASGLARFAAVIGNNLPLEGSGDEPLQYADDDALRFAQFFGDLGAKVALFTAPVALGRADDRKAVMLLGCGIGAALAGSGLICALELDR